MTASTPPRAPTEMPEPWFTPGVRGIGTASLLADVGHEVPTALLPSFLTTDARRAGRRRSG